MNKLPYCLKPDESLLKKHLVVFLAFICSTLPLFAQSGNISGKVVDSKGEPLIGVSVKTANSSAVTNIEGAYNIHASETETLVFSYIGYQKETVPVRNRRVVNVTMNEDSKIMDEVVVVGYGSQKKVTLTGAVSAVTKKEIVTSTTSNVKDMLSGKLPGVRVQQQTGEPGSYSSKLDIRGLGTPLVVIDGVIRDDAAFQRLDGNEIESVSVLKDASAAIYGVRAANGVILVTTRKGVEGKTTVEYSGSYGFQTPSGMPPVLSASQWAELVREADRNMGRGVDATYTLSDVERFKVDGGTDWYGMVVNNYVPQNQNTVTISGSTPKTKYFLSLGNYGEKGIWKSNDLDYNRYSVRTNLSFILSKNLSFDVLLSGTTDVKNQPYKDVWEVFKSIWMLRPTDKPYADSEGKYLQNDDLKSYGLNPLAITNSDYCGYKTNRRNILNTTFSLNYDMPFVKGLKAKLLYACDYSTNNAKEFKKSYTLYSHDATTDTYTPHAYNYPSTLYRSFSESGQNQFQASLDYETAINKEHTIKALFLYEQTKLESDNFYAQRNLVMDALDEIYTGSKEEQIGSSNPAGRGISTNMAYVGRLGYDYLSKYIAEFTFRYDGSSKFAPGHQWGFFPAGSVAYRLSEEKFIKDNDKLKFINNLKIRASYGILGDDSQAGYKYISGYDYPGANYIFNGTAYNGLSFRALPNADLTWFTSHTMNYGMDLDAWNGMLSIQVDFFWRYRYGLLGTRSDVPSVLGASLPTENLNADLYKGFEVALGHKNKIGKFNYSVSANFGITRSQWLARSESDAVNSYDYWRNKYSYRYNDISWGYGSNGQFSSMQQIWNSAIQDGQGGATQLPGDWKYQDWNGDGIIDSQNDFHPIYTSTENPKITFGSTITCSYKGFDFNMLLQGGAFLYVRYLEQLQYPLCFGGNGLATFYDRYRQDDNGNWIAGKWPTTYDPGQHSVNYANCEQTAYNGSYIRL
ncbi:MAG TPA: TonB-dependent receptor, partial [Paludibacter sp.]|nr:TonB-dependent receptor [Paludibacter sp.]